MPQFLLTSSCFNMRPRLQDMSLLDVTLMAEPDWAIPAK